MTYTPTNTFVAGNLIKSTEVNENFNQAATQVSDTSTGHDHDGSNSKYLPTDIYPIVYLSYEMMTQSGTFNNQNPIAVDIFTDDNGTNNTINTSSSTAHYRTADEDFVAIDSVLDGTETITSSGVTNPGNATDGDRDTYATYTGGNGQIEITFSSRYVDAVYLKSGNTGGLIYYREIYTYDGSTWTKLSNFSSGETYYDLQDTIQGIRIKTVLSANSGDALIYEILPYVYANKTVKATNTITLEGDEKGLMVYEDATNTANTSIDVDVSDGSTTLSNQSLRTLIDISSLSSGGLQLTFNLNTTDNTETPTLSGYSVVVTK